MEAPLIFRLGRLLGLSLVLCILCYMILPSIIVIITAFNADSSMAFPPSALSLRWFEKAISYEDFRAGFLNSALITACAATIAVVVGTTSAYAIDRFSFRGKALLEATLLSPLMIPNFTIGLAFLILAASASISGTFAIVVLTHVIVVLPFVLRNVYVSIKNLNPMVARAAESLGASPLRVFVLIDLPLLVPGIFGGFLFSAILSFNEVTASLFVTSQRTQTLPVAMFAYITDYPDPSMAAISALLILAVSLILLGANRYLGLRRVFAIENKR